MAKSTPQVVKTSQCHVANVIGSQAKQKQPQDQKLKHSKIEI